MALLSGNAPLLPQNILPITNSLVFTCIVFVYIETTGGRKKKAKSDHSTQIRTKLLASSTQHFVGHPLEKKKKKKSWNQSFPVTINRFLTPLCWNFGPVFFLPTAIGLLFDIRDRRVEGHLFPIAVLKSLRRSSLGFILNSPALFLRPLWMLFEVYFGSLCSRLSTGHSARLWFLNDLSQVNFITI